MPELKPKLVLSVGGMFAGKSTELLRQGEKHMIAGHKVVYLKPEIDDRYSVDEIVTHDGKRVKALTIRNLELSMYSIYVAEEVKEADVILIDEIQFFKDSFIDWINGYLEAGKVVYVAGLDMDYSGEPFNITAQLMAMADDVTKYKAVCRDCGSDAYVSSRTRVLKENPSVIKRIDLGSQDKYKPVCRDCFYKS